MIISTMLLVTVFSCVTLGVAAGYLAIFCILRVISPRVAPAKATAVSASAITARSAITSG